MTDTGEQLAEQLARGTVVDDGTVATLLVPLTQLLEHVQILQTGGRLVVGDGHTLDVPAMHGGLFTENASAVRAAAERYRGLLESLVQHATLTPQAIAQAGRDVRTTLQGLSAIIESESLTTVLRLSEWQLLSMIAASALFLLWAWLVNRWVTLPLNRMADGIHAMQQTGRLIKLPVMQQDELGVVATAFNQLAEQVEEQKRRLREHIVELQRLSTEFEEMSRLKDDFLATISHQLRTPLLPILEGVGLLKDGTLGRLNVEQEAFLRTMQENAKQLADLTEKALALSLVRSGRSPLRLQPEHLTTFLRETQTNWQAVAGRRTIKLDVAQLPDVYLDAQAIRSVLDQLLCNALRHAPEPSDIVVTAYQVNAMVEVSVRDQGPGISEAQMAQLFQPFTHVQTPDAPGSQGSGLGLAFCRQVIERHRGQIRATSAEGRGMTVMFTLPLATPQVMLEDACQTAQEDTEHEHGQFGLLLLELAPASSAAATDTMRHAHQLLLRSTHRDDRFIWLDPSTLVIVAVADHSGIQAMAHRLAEVIKPLSPALRFGIAMCPVDGRTGPELVASARRMQQTRG